MATRQVFGGEWRLAVDTAWRQKLLGHVQRAFASKSRSEYEAAKKTLLEHGYLMPDPAGEAEQTDQRQRYSRCRKMLDGLKARLARGQITQLGLEGATGQASLTVERLSRFVRLLDLNDDWLLIALERHPFGGGPSVLVHHWLYSKRRSTVQLLHVDEIAYVKPEAVKVKRGNGPWRDPAGDLENDFTNTVRQLLGDGALASLQRLVTGDDSGLCGEDGDVIAQCEEISGVPYSAQEAARRLARDAAYRRKYGPPKLPPGIGLVADRIRLGYAREK